METSQRIRNAVSTVSQLRQAQKAQPGLQRAVGEVKRLQSRRFAGSYADLLGGGDYAAAARFFLDELYSDRDYEKRDAQFARIAGTIEAVFPVQVQQTAVALAELHCLTEQLDHAMALQWMEPALADLAPAQRYATAWQAVAQRGQREEQLVSVLRIGEQMAQLTRTPGLRLMLRMMRAPASAAGMGALQAFLEAGFDTFGAVARKSGGVQAFLGIIRQRESELIATLFGADLVASGTSLQSILGQAR